MWLGMMALGILAWQAGGAPKPSPEAAFEARLKKTGLAYAVDKDGDYRFELRWNQEKRSHLVYVRKARRIVGDTAVRDLFALCWRGDARPEPDVLERLLVTQYRIGGFHLEKGETSGKWTGFYSVQLPETVSAEFLGRIINLVGEAADNFERDTLGTDDL